MLGAVVGALLRPVHVGAAAFDAGGAGAPALGPGVAVGKGIVIEAILTFFLVFVVFGTAVDERGLEQDGGVHDRVDDRVRHPRVRTADRRGDESRALVRPRAGGRDLGDAIVWIVGPIAGAIIAGVLYTAVLLRGREPATP